VTKPDLTKALLDVMQRYPDLTIDGLGGDSRPDLERRRSDLIAAHDQFERAVAWLRLVPKVQTPRRSSYYLKHAAERWAGAYVSNGALIAAAVHLGFPIERSPSHINANIGVTTLERRWPGRDSARSRAPLGIEQARGEQQP
jgi:hypothetical protein